MNKKAIVALVLLTLLIPELTEPAYGMINTKNFYQPLILNFNFFSQIINKVANILSKLVSRILGLISFLEIKNSAQSSASEYDYLYPYIFEGVHDTFVNPYVVKYYNSSTAQQYWRLANISSNVPVLQLNNAKEWTQGLVFWNETYTSGETITISFIGVYTSGVQPVADGFEVYLFLKPSMWNISPYWNKSATFPALIFNYSTPSAQNKTEVWNETVLGELALPQSLSPYIIVQWNPWLQIGTGEMGSGGQWNIGIFYNPNNINPIYIVYTALGNGSFTPNPGNYIFFSVTYNPSNNIIIGIAKDLNTSQEAILIFQMPYHLFLSSGYYVFGIGASTGGSHVANWGIININVPALKPLFMRSPIKLYNVTFTQTGLSPGTSWSVSVIGKTFYGLYINKTITSTASTITFILPNGTYYYRIGNVSGYKSYPATGEISVSNENVSVNIYFVSLNWTTLEQNLAYSNGYIFYVNSTFDEVEVINATTGQVVKVFRTGIYPVSVASYWTLAMEYGGVFNEYKDIVVVANEGSNNITFINSSSLQIIGGVSVGKEPLGIALGNGTVAVSNYGSKDISIIAIFDSPTFVPFVIDEISLSDHPTGIVFNPITNELFVSLYNSHKIAMYKVSLSSLSVSFIGFLQTQANPMGLAIDPNGWLYVAQEGTSYIGIFVPINVSGVPLPFQPICSLCYIPWPTYTVKVGDHPVNVIVVSTSSDLNSQEFSVVISYLNSSNVSFIPVSLIDENAQNQQLYFNITYNGVVSGIAPGNSLWYYIAGGVISSTNVYPIFFNYSGGQVAYSINGLVFKAPATIPLPPGIYNLSYTLEVGYKSPKILTYGEIYYSSGELTVYGPGTVIVNSTEILTNWIASGYFNVKWYVIDLGQIGPFVINSKLLPYPIFVYFLTPANGENLSTFYEYLHYYFNITVPSGYQPFMTIIFSVPLIPIINGIFGTNLPEKTYVLPLGEYLSFLGVQNIIAPYGGFNLAITISSPTTSQMSLEDLLLNVLSTLASDLITIGKGDIIIKPEGINESIELIESILDNLETSLEVITSVADITVTDITSFLLNNGPLSGYTVLDLVTMENNIRISLLENTTPYFATAATILEDVYGIYESIGEMIEDPIKGAIEYGLDMISLAMTLTEIVVPSLSDNSLFNAFESAVSIVVGVLDPNGSTILPSFYINNTLVLGYNASNGNMIFQSPYGVLEQVGNTYYAYIYPQYSHWISVKLISIGGNSPAPYILTIKTNSSYLSFTGMVPGNSSLAIPVSVTSSGLVKSITYLSPKLTVKQEANSYLITLQSYLNNDEPYDATSAILIIGNKEFYMTKVNATTFQISIPYGQITSNHIMVYIPSSQYPGGYASVYLPMYKVIFVESGLPNGTRWNVTLNNITEYSYSNEIVFYELNGYYSFSIGTVNGYVVHPSNGTILVNGTNVIVNLTFISKNETTTTITTTTSTTTSTSSTTTTSTTTQITTTSSVPTTLQQITSTVNTTSSVPTTSATTKTLSSRPNYIIYLAIIIIVLIAVVTYLVIRKR